MIITATGIHTEDTTRLATPTGWRMREQFTVLTERVRLDTTGDMKPESFTIARLIKMIIPDTTVIVIATERAIRLIATAATGQTGLKGSMAATENASAAL